MEGIATWLGSAATVLKIVGKIPGPQALGLNIVAGVATGGGIVAAWAGKRYRDQFDKQTEECLQQIDNPDQPAPPSGGRQPGTYTGGGGVSLSSGYSAPRTGWRWEPGSVTEEDGVPVITAGRWIPFFSPIILDLGGDGISYRSAANPVVHDADGDLRSEALAWIGASDGILVYDYNQNGIGEAPEWALTSFVSGAKNDLEALRAFDSNRDGGFSSADQEFAKFRIGKDLNQDGLLTAGELFSFAELGVASISVAAGVTAHGGTQIVDGVSLHHSGQFTRTNGTTSTFHDAAFRVDQYSAVIHQDASATVVSRGASKMFVATSSAPLIVDLSGFSYAGHGGFIDVTGGDGNDIIYGNSEANFLHGGGGSDQLHGGAGDDVISADSADLLYASVSGGSGTDTLILTSATMTVNAAALGFELIIAGEGNHVLDGAGSAWVFFEGGAGHDTLFGSAGNDTLSGGTGSDGLRGYGGDDTYVFSKETGWDVVSDSAGNDVAIFSDIAMGDVYFEEYDNGITRDFFIVLADGSQRVRFESNRDYGSGVETFIFADGIMSREDINQAIDMSMWTPYVPDNSSEYLV